MHPFSKFGRFAFSLFVGLFFGLGIAHGQQAADAIAPEFGKTRQSNSLVQGKSQMIAAAILMLQKPGWLCSTKVAQPLMQ